METGAKARRGSGKGRDHLEPQLVIALSPWNVNNPMQGGINEPNARRPNLSHGAFDGDAN
jgi:hypothetical protein